MVVRSKSWVLVLLLVPMAVLELVPVLVLVLELVPVLVLAPPHRKIQPPKE